jgi:hypothetical protein
MFRHLKGDGQMKCSIMVFVFLAAAAWPVHAQSLRGVPTYHNIGVHVEFGAAPPAQTSIALAIKESGAPGDYRTIHPLSRIATNRFAGSAFWLQPDTTYSLRLTSAAFVSNQFLTLRTRSEALPDATNGAYHVAMDGNDENDGRSQASAFRTLRHALEVVHAGERILLHAGRYYEGDIEVHPGSSGESDGTPAEPIVIESDPGEAAILDGTDPDFAPAWQVFDAPHGIYRTPTARQPYHAYLNGGHLYHFGDLDDLRTNRWGQMSGYYADGTNLYVRLPGGGAPGTNQIAMPRFTYGLMLVLVGHYQIRNLEFCYYGYDRDPAALGLDSSSSNVIEHCTFHHTGTGIVIRHDSSHNTIQRCSFSEWPVDQFMWDAVKQGVPFGSEPYETGGVFMYGDHTTYYGNVIRSNRFDHMFDGAHLFSDDANAPTENLDFHDNVILNCGDDGIETDGVGSNCRIYNNVISNFLTGISVAPAALGPTYVFRNVLQNWRCVPSVEGEADGMFHGYPIKLNHQMREDPWTQWVYLYHNTCVTDGPELDGFLFSYYWWYWKNIVSRNNIYMGTRYAIANVDEPCPIDFDYDDLFTTHPSLFAYWYGVEYASLAELTAGTGQERHGLAVAPGFVGAGDLQLRPDSPLIDRGVYIPGVNDDFLGTAPDPGAFEFAGAAPVATAIACDADVVRTCWRIAPGSTWQADWTPSLAPTQWVAIGTPGPATGYLIVAHHTNVAPRAFYRLRSAAP